jgi:hypothetical protein
VTRDVKKRVDCHLESNGAQFVLSLCGPEAELGSANLGFGLVPLGEVAWQALWWVSLYYTLSCCLTLLSDVAHTTWDNPPPRPTSLLKVPR